MMVEATAPISSKLAIAEPVIPLARVLPAIHSSPDGEPDSTTNIPGKEKNHRNLANLFESVMDKAKSSDRREPADLYHVDLSTSEIIGPSLKVHFQSNQETGRVAISVIDAKTEEVIREIPSEEVQKVIEKLKNNLGLMFDRNS